MGTIIINFTELAVLILSILRFNTRMNTRQVYCVVCGIRVTDSLSLKTSEHHRNVGSFPSAPNCSLGRMENRAVLGQPRQTWTLLQPRLLRFVFDFITARPHSEQTSSSNQTVNDGLAVSLAFAVVHTFPRHRLHKEMISVILPSPTPAF